MLAFMEFISFPDRKDSLFKDNEKLIDIEASGSIGVWDGAKCHQTYPNSTIIVDKKTDWCSNVATEKGDKPWITYSMRGKQMKVSSFSVRNGCCYYACCCLNDKDIIEGCCCDLYSFSLQGSNDNKTWKTLFKAEKEQDFYYCKFKSYDVKSNDAYRYIRFVQDEPSPGCIFCMAINQLELYGQLTDSRFAIESDADDESVSIIGKIRKNDM